MTRHLHNAQKFFRLLFLQRSTKKLHLQCVDHAQFSQPLKAKKSIGIWHPEGAWIHPWCQHFWKTKLKTDNKYLQITKNWKTALAIFKTNEFQKDVDHYTSFNSMSSNEVTRIQRIMEYGTNAKSNPHNYNNAWNFKPFDLYLSSKTNLIWCHVNWLQQLRHSISRNLIMKNLDITPNQSTNIWSLFCL